ncbi:MAG: hypothetical protein P8K08_25900, partial [Fuerstiella sp.]|nr:hypothetical protein [Fuerstiella sp.]
MRAIPILLLMVVGCSQATTDEESVQKTDSKIQNSTINVQLGVANAPNNQQTSNVTTPSNIPLDENGQPAKDELAFEAPKGNPYLLTGS